MAPFVYMQVRRDETSELDDRLLGQPKVEAELAVGHAVKRVFSLEA